MSTSPEPGIPSTHGRTLLRNFGGSSASSSTLHLPEDDQEWHRLFTQPGPGGVTVRGAGASYSDAALNEGGTVAATTGHPRILGWDRERGVLDADAGVTLQEAISFCTPRGWSFPVIPGTARVTLGGAFAADVHGMNHPVEGTFSGCVRQIDLATPAQSVVRVSPVEQPEVFWATAGGLGLTGAIIRLRLQLTRTNSNWMITSDTACTGVDDVLETMEERAEQYEHVEGWIDGYAPAKEFGRGVVSAADRMEAADLPASVRGTPLMYAPPMRSPGAPKMVRPALVRAANALHYSRAKRHTGGQISDYAHTFHRQDAVAGSPILYGHHGMLQYQFAIRTGGEQMLHTALQQLTITDFRPSLITLKRLGQQSYGHLSFPFPGWAMTLNFPTAMARDASALLHRLDLAVCGTGGRINLVTNHRTRPALIPHMYPRLQQWRSVRDRLDPDGILTSDLNRRLNLTGHHESEQS